VTRRGSPDWGRREYLDAPTISQSTRGGIGGEEASGTSQQEEPWVSGSLYKGVEKLTILRHRWKGNMFFFTAVDGKDEIARTKD